MLALRLLFVVGFVFGASVPGGWLRAGCHTERQSLGSDENLFGPEVRGHKNLFELNKDFVVKVQFDRSGQTSGVMAIPKYYLEACEPSWTEPDHLVGLSEDESQEIVAKAGKLKTVGSLISKGSIGVVTNSKLWLVDQYQSAFVRRLLNRTAQDQDQQPERTHSLSVYFIRKIEGVVQDQQVVNQVGRDKQLKLKIDGSWYLTTESEFDRAKVGNQTSVQAAGPIDTVNPCQ